MLGEARTAVAARPAMAVAWRAQEQAGRVACGNGAREERFQGNKGRRSGFGRRCDAWGGQVAAPAYGAAVGVVQGDGGGRNGQWQFRN